MSPNLLHDFISKHILMDKSGTKHLQPVAEIVREKNEHNQAKGVGAAFLYGACSVSTAFINKILMTTYEFDYPVVIMVLQMTYTIILLQFLSLLKLINLPKLTYGKVKTFAWPAICYAVNSILALSALSHMNVAMYGVLKRCVPIATLALSVLVLKKSCPSRITIVAVLLLSLGCIVAGYGDMKFNLTAYTCGFLSNITQAMYLLLVQLCCEQKMSTIETLQLNSVNTLPLLIGAAVVKDEFIQVQHFSYGRDPLFFLVLFMVLNMGCFLNYSLFLCTSCNCALTTSVVGGIKALAQTILGLFTFGGVSLNISTFVGITMNSSGGILYIYAKFVDNKSKNIGNTKNASILVNVEHLGDSKNSQESQMSNGIGSSKLPPV